MGKTSLYIITGIISFGGLIALGVRSCNTHYNDRTEKKQGYQLISFADGVDGHTECVFYEDNSLDVRVQESFSNGDVTFIQDLDGDGLADRIRVQGSKAERYALDSLLIRKYDFKSHSKEFKEADKTIKSCISKR